MIVDSHLAGHPIRYLQETDSTNDIARKAAAAGADKGTVVIAERQTKGRGRLGRSWISPPGIGLYFSVILSPELPAADLAKITLTTGVALCRAIRGYLDYPMLKWPNDLLLQGKKVAGILTETMPMQNSRPMVILGIGINVNHPKHGLPTELADTIGTIQAAYGKPLPRGELLERILRQNDELLDQAEREGFSNILEEWRSYDACRMRYLSWLTTEGRVIRGLSRGIDDEGLLRIQDEEGKVHEVVSGDITIGTTIGTVPET